MTMIKEHPIVRPKLIKRRYHTVNMADEFETGLDRKDKTAIFAAAVYKTREQKPSMLDKKYKWKLINIEGDNVRLRYSWR